MVKCHIETVILLNYKDEEKRLLDNGFLLSLLLTYLLVITHLFLFKVCRLLNVTLNVKWHKERYKSIHQINTIYIFRDGVTWTSVRYDVGYKHCRSGRNLYIHATLVQLELDCYSHWHMTFLLLENISWRWQFAFSFSPVIGIMTRRVNMTSRGSF